MSSRDTFSLALCSSHTGLPSFPTSGSLLVVATLPGHSLSPLPLPSYAPSGVRLHTTSSERYSWLPSLNWVLHILPVQSGHFLWSIFLIVVIYLFVFNICLQLDCKLPVGWDSSVPYRDGTWRPACHDMTQPSIDWRNSEVLSGLEAVGFWCIFCFLT